MNRVADVLVIAAVVLILAAAAVWAAAGRQPGALVLFAAGLTGMTGGVLGLAARRRAGRGER